MSCTRCREHCPTVAGSLRYRDVEVWPALRFARVGGREVSLSMRECEALAVLVAQRGHPIESADLEARVVGPCWHAETPYPWQRARYARTLVWRLRQKLGPDRIRARQQGGGYWLAPVEEANGA